MASEETIFILRAELDDVDPPAWRRLAVTSTMTLDELHSVLQYAFGWQDCHLHRFASGGDPFSPESTAYLGEFEIEDGEPGIPEGEARLDAVLPGPGSVLRYAYDYGDGWELELSLEEIVAREPGMPRAKCLDGQRPHIPEDCGGPGGYAVLAAAHEHPTAENLAAVREQFHDDGIINFFTVAPLDIDVVNTILAQLIPISELPPLILELRASVGPGARPLAMHLAREARLADEPEIPGRDAATMVHSFRWLIDRCRDGVTLTKAGYLPPSLVKDAFTELGIDKTWYGTGDRENNVYPLLRLRTAAQKLGLLRKSKGTLASTKQALAVVDDPEALLALIVRKMPVSSAQPVELQARALYLLLLAAGPRSGLFDELAELLNAFGWQMSDGPVLPIDARDLAGPVHDVMEHLGILGTPAAAALARQVLRRG